MPSVGADPTVLGRTPAATRARPEPPTLAFNQLRLVFEGQVLRGSRAPLSRRFLAARLKAAHPRTATPTWRVTFRTTGGPDTGFPAGSSRPDPPDPRGDARLVLTEV
jgi:hypothetical protein